MKTTNKNPFFPEDCPFEVLGFYEDIYNATTGRYMGNRPMTEPDRPTGSPGEKRFVIEETVTLKKGHKFVEYKASKDKPITVDARIEILCGRVRPQVRKEEPRPHRDLFWKTRRG